RVAVARFDQLRSWRGQDLERTAVVEREGLVYPRFVEPQSDQLLELLGFLGGEIVQLGPVDLCAVELPGVLVEVAPAAQRRVGGDRLPAVVPDRPGAEHRVELRPACARQAGCVEAVADADDLA